VVGALGGWEVEEVADGVPEPIDGALGGLAQQGALSLAKACSIGLRSPFGRVQLLIPRRALLSALQVLR
jgi:hypothetical protein